MILNDIPSFVGIRSPEFRSNIDKIYNSEFLSQIFIQLNISDEHKAEQFGEFLKKSAVSYLTGRDMNSGRIQPNEQKTIFRNYATALKEVQRRFGEVKAHNFTHANFHDSLKDVIKANGNDGLKDMFSPYVSLGDGQGSYGGISDKMFEDFIGALIEAADKAPSYIDEYDKANIDGEYISWWLQKIGQRWEDYTTLPFAVGDYYKELGIYKSPCLDVLYDLLNAVDNRITRKDIETAMRKYKKSE